MLRIVVALTLIVVATPAIAGPTDGATHCSTLDATLDPTYSSTWYEFCGGIMSARAEASVYYAQVTLSCTTSPNACTYQPTMHVAVDALAPGEWVIRGTSRITNYPGGSYLSGSTRAIECRVTGLDPHCDAAGENRQITAGNFNSYRFDGTWRLSYVDPTGAEHLQATGANDGWLAQYYSG